MQVPIHAITLEHGDIGKFGNDMVVKRLEFWIDVKCGSIVCSAEAGEDHLTMPHNVKVRDIDEECIEDDHDILGEDIEMSLVGKNKSLYDLERAMDITCREGKKKGRKGTFSQCVLQCRSQFGTLSTCTRSIAHVECFAHKIEQTRSTRGSRRHTPSLPVSLS